MAAVTAMLYFPMIDMGCSQLAMADESKMKAMSGSVTNVPIPQPEGNYIAACRQPS